MDRPTIDELSLLHDNLCRALGDPKRLLILYTLYDAPQHVSVLAEALEMPQPTISRHLAVLRQCSLVEAEREGSTVVYRLRTPRIIEIVNAMRALLRESLELQSSALDNQPSA